MVDSYYDGPVSGYAERNGIVRGRKPREELMEAEIRVQMELRNVEAREAGIVADEIADALDGELLFTSPWVYTEKLIDGEFTANIRVPKTVRLMHRVLGDRFVGWLREEFGSENVTVVGVEVR